jgi:hypothetical protein
MKQKPLRVLPTKKHSWKYSACVNDSTQRLSFETDNNTNVPDFAWPPNSRSPAARTLSGTTTKHGDCTTLWHPGKAAKATPKKKRKRRRQPWAFISLRPLWLYSFILGGMGGV